MTLTYHNEPRRIGTVDPQLKGLRGYISETTHNLCTATQRPFRVCVRYIRTTAEFCTGFADANSPACVAYRSIINLATLPITENLITNPMLQYLKFSRLRRRRIWI